MRRLSTSKKVNLLKEFKNKRKNLPGVKSDSIGLLDFKQTYFPTLSL